MEITYKEVKKIPLKKKIISHAEGDIHRMNAKTADCYAFGYEINSKGKNDFFGGWDWSNYLVDKEAEYIYKFSDKKFYKVIKQ